jgi:hypothetical protein
MYATVLNDARLLDTWDRAATLERPWRELAVLAGASGQPIDDLARLSIGARDRLLLGVRIATFGSRLDCETTCPACGTRLELSLDARDLVVPERDIASSDLEVNDDGWRVCFRLPDSMDIAACGKTTTAGDVLAERCLDVTSGEQPAAVSALPRRIRDRVTERMAELDAQADVSLDLTCAACNHGWPSPFDPAAFLLREVDSHAARLTTEVHQLARAYGWSEDSILAMGPARRRRYLSLVLQ